MAFEIERKFLVNNKLNLELALSKTRIVQAYLFNQKDKSLRLRLSNNNAYLTFKASTETQSNIKRHEHEQSIPIEEGKELLKKCEPGKIEKLRYIFPVGQHHFEVDVFEGDNHGLVIAEVELQSESEAFEKPEWLGKEVTRDTRYLNAELIKNPYINWKP